MRNIEDFFELKKETWTEEIEKEDNIDYLIGLGRAFEKSDEITRGERMYYGLLISKRMVRVVNGSPILIHQYFDF